MTNNSQIIYLSKLYTMFQFCGFHPFIMSKIKTILDKNFLIKKIREIYIHSEIV